MSQFVVTRKMFFANSVGSDGQKGEYFKIALALVIKNLIEKMKALHVFCPSQGSNLIFMEEFFFRFLLRRWRGGSWLPTHLLPKLFQHSVTNKTLSRLFKALPGGSETRIEERGGRGVGVAMPTLAVLLRKTMRIFKPDVQSIDIM